MESIGELSAADLRAMVARTRRPRYVIATAAGMHPTTFSMLLNEKRPLSSDLIERIVAAIQGK